MSMCCDNNVTMVSSHNLYEFITYMEIDLFIYGRRTKKFQYGIILRIIYGNNCFIVYKFYKLLS